MCPDLVRQHIAAMTTASDNLLRQMASEGLRYRLAVAHDDTATMQVYVRGLTPEVEGRIRHCLVGTGMLIAITEG